jgi:hypothetical protein
MRKWLFAQIHVVLSCSVAMMSYIVSAWRRCGWSWWRTDCENEEACIDAEFKRSECHVEHGEERLLRRVARGVESELSIEKKGREGSGGEVFMPSSSALVC